MQDKKLNYRIELKKGYSTRETLTNGKEYKTYGKQLHLCLLDLLRPNAENIFNIEILVNLHMHFVRSTIPYRRVSNVYGLKYLINSEQTFGKSAVEMKESILKILRKLIFDDSLSEDEVCKWRHHTPAAVNSCLNLEFKHYKNWVSWPQRGIGTPIDKLLAVDKKEKFEWNPNSHWKEKARAVVGKYFNFYGGDDDKRYFRYCINYSTANREASSWEVIIESNPDESFIDFVIRLSKHNFLTVEGKKHLRSLDAHKYYELIG